MFLATSLANENIYARLKESAPSRKISEHEARTNKKGKHKLARPSAQSGLQTR